MATNPYATGGASRSSSAYQTIANQIKRATPTTNTNQLISSGAGTGGAQSGGRHDTQAYQDLANSYEAGLKRIEESKIPKNTTDLGNLNSSKSDWLNSFSSEMESILNNTVAAIDEKINNVRGYLDNYNKSLNDSEQAQIDESELQRYRNKSAIRESLANRGQLDSGMGEFSQLQSSLAAAKRIADIRKQFNALRNEAELSARNDMNTLESSKVDARNNYANALLQAKLANM